MSSSPSFERYVLFLQHANLSRSFSGRLFVPPYDDEALLSLEAPTVGQRNNVSETLRRYVLAANSSCYAGGRRSLPVPSEPRQRRIRADSITVRHSGGAHSTRASSDRAGIALDHDGGSRSGT